MYKLDYEQIDDILDKKNVDCVSRTVYFSLLRRVEGNKGTIQYGQSTLSN